MTFVAILKRSFTCSDLFGTATNKGWQGLFLGQQEHLAPFPSWKLYTLVFVFYVLFNFVLLGRQFPNRL